VFGIHQANKSFDQIIDITKRPRLFAVTVNGQILAAQSLNDKILNYAPVVLQHSWSVSIEDPSQARVNAVLPVIIHKQSFGDAFSFVVTAANPDRINVSR
jgi:hypothetical protein